MAYLRKIVAAGILMVTVVLGIMVYNVFRTPPQASRSIEAIPLAGNNTDSSNSSTELPSSSTADTLETTPGAVVMQIVQDESEARFVIDEVLNNAPKTVVGTTDQVAGEIAVDPENPTQSQVGIIQVNARTFTTDGDFRNRAINNEILETDQYEFITFTPTELVGLPQSGAVGESYSFQIAGNLTIRNVAKPVTFDVTVTPTSETRVEGTAQTTIRYADYDITIPQVRQVARVADEVRLEIDFVAAAA